MQRSGVPIFGEFNCDFDIDAHEWVCADVHTHPHSMTRTSGVALLHTHTHTHSMTREWGCSEHPHCPMHGWKEFGVETDPENPDPLLLVSTATPCPTVNLLSWHEASQNIRSQFPVLTPYGVRWSKVNFAPERDAALWLACPVCRAKFSLLKSRFHCRLCGGVFCEGCLLRSVQVR